MKNDRLYIIIFVFILLLLSATFFSDITGYVISKSLSVSVAEKISGKITAFTFNSTVPVGTRHVATVEFTNTGTNTYTNKIEIKLHKATGNNLTSIATYQDAPVVLTPGMRNDFSIIYFANETGLFYFQAKATYETKFIESWGPFFVLGPGNATPGGGNGTGGTNGTGSTNGTGGTGGQAANVIFNFRTIVPGLAILDSASPNATELRKGDGVLVGIRAINKGNVRLTNLRIFLSLPLSIDIDINPKAIPFIETNETGLFLISLTSTNITELGRHLLNYEILSNEAKTSGFIELIVTDRGLDADAIKERILNYQLLILEIKDEISKAKRKGFITDESETALRKAQNSIEAAKVYLNSGEYEKAYNTLVDTKRFIEESVYLLANAMLILRVAPASEVYAIFILTIVGVMAAYIYRDLRKNKKRKPKMLEEATKED